LIHEAGDMVEGVGLTAGNSLTGDSGLIDAPEGHPRLQEGSPAIHAGDPATDLSLFPGGPDAPFDLDGNPRVQDS
jgi:hypothetical protein